MKLAVVGAGAWGINHVRVIAEHPACELVAVADPDRAAWDRVRRFAPEAQLHADPDALLAGGVADAVVIASPAPTHAVFARRAIDAGLHVLIEKPVALRLDDALALRDRAARSDRVAMIGHLMVFHPAVVRLRKLLGSGALGTLHYLHSTRVNLGRHRQDENVLWSFGPHDLSMFDFLLGALPASVSARGHSMLQPGIEDVVFFTLRYTDGAMANVHLSWLHPRKERRLTLVGSHQMVEFDDVAPEKLRVYEPARATESRSASVVPDRRYDRPPEFTQFAQYLTLRDGDVHIPQLPMIEPLRAQLDHFVDCMATGTAPRADLDSGVRVTAVLEAAQRSLEQDGAPVVLAQEFPALDALNRRPASGH